jgi:hypothetical protein
MQVFSGKIFFLNSIFKFEIFLLDEIHRRRQFRTRKERLEKRRQQQAEFAESQKLLSQCKLIY